MLHKLLVATSIAGALRGTGFMFDVPEGATPPGSYVHCQNGEVMFRPYAEPCAPHEVAEYEAHQATLQAEAEADAARAREAAVDAAGQPPAPQPAGTRVRLTAPAFMDGALREPGYEFVLPDGDKGPMHTVRELQERIDLARDGRRLDAVAVDKPLYEVVTDA